ncbi:hypothetical protein EOM39_06975 [Candidatus Gracilibacteria bacterium]|nr:hypothetical protein [Candidatus Gracilibacteria bacterium]
MKKIYIIISLIFVIFLLVTFYQVFIILMSEVTGLPNNMSQEDFDRTQIIYTVGRNLVLFFISALAVYIISYKKK